ncbi:hypothetical protein MNEG_0201 [Monoraphidium neglectum]|uniref:Dienelactone hydrolase domain-containing protein n=1 Tax=Monoraphidium neglectum TaxID=145388 RepID=A0A0D2NUI3_9CHLO|nr:hypothetical protein MNEG_0201 [Monoraphidium neglectum]KIZ07756.1 hypothetical protein MNEG_0201 [Monoraphidium neglectum]|eukprot:XP_013906775.1 hypothetical protein MNEG_0201 [Monoraphidium neglectum]
MCECKALPIRFDYTPKGKVEALGGDLEGYVVAGTKPAAIIMLYDIFGYTEYPQIKQVCDHLSAATGFTVAIPDVFRGKPWSMAKSPAKPEDNLIGWIQSVGSYAKVSSDLKLTVDFLRARGAERFGIAGTCWGASIALTACSQPDGVFEACAGLHPSLFGKDKEFAEALLRPVALVSARGDPLETVQEVVNGKPDLAPKCIWKRMDDVEHGFCAARGDYKNEVVTQRVAEAVQLLAGFFTSNVA